MRVPQLLLQLVLGQAIQAALFLLQSPLTAATTILLAPFPGPEGREHTQKIRSAHCCQMGPISGVVLGKGALHSHGGHKPRTRFSPSSQVTILVCPATEGLYQDTRAAHTTEMISKVQGHKVSATEPRQALITDDSLPNLGDSSPRVHPVTPRTKSHRTKGSLVSTQSTFLHTKPLLFLHSEQGLALVTRDNDNGHLCVDSHRSSLPVRVFIL